MEKMDVEMFIEKVRKHRYLYDKSTPNYKDIDLKRTTWDVIGKAFGLSGKEAEKRWKTQRDRFRKEKNKVQSSSGTGTGTQDLYTSKWQYFKQMEGIMERMPETQDRLKTYIGNVEEEEEMATEDAYQDSSILLDLDLTLTDAEEICGQSQATSSGPGAALNVQQKEPEVPQETGRKKRKQINEEMMSSAWSAFEQTSDLLANQKQDANDHFCELLKCRLRQLSEKDQFLARRKIELSMWEIEELQYQ